MSSGCIKHVITRRMPSKKNHERISLFVSNFRSSESLKIRKRPRKSLRTLSVVFNVMNQYDENVRELPSEQKIVIHTKRSTRSLLQNLTHSLHLGFPHWVKVILSGIGPAMARYKVNCFHLLVACSQSSFTSVWTSLATQELQISFQCW